MSRRKPTLLDSRDVKEDISALKAKLALLLLSFDDDDLIVPLLRFEVVRRVGLHRRESFKLSREEVVD
eukprot:1352144-Amorphochlora_amoeboformis.AAC.1